MWQNGIVLSRSKACDKLQSMIIYVRHFHEISWLDALQTRLSFHLFGFNFQSKEQKLNQLKPVWREKEPNFQIKLKLRWRFNRLLLIKLDNQFFDFDTFLKPASLQKAFASQFNVHWLFIVNNLLFFWNKVSFIKEQFFLQKNTVLKLAKHR